MKLNLISFFQESKMTTSSSNKLQDKFHNPLSEYINITVFAELKQVQHSIFSFANKIHLHESKQDFKKIYSIF